jgi:hypothetical protein
VDTKAAFAARLQAFLFSTAIEAGKMAIWENAEGIKETALGAADVAVYAVRVSCAVSDKRQRLGANGVGERPTAATLDVVDDLRTRPVEKAGMKEPSQSVADLLVRRIEKSADVIGAEQPVTRDLAQDRDVALGQLEGRGS